MSWRSLFISRPARLSIRNYQLEIEQEGEKVQVPLEDIGLILIESPQVNLTAKLLARLGEEKILLFFCDDKHLPCAIVQPFHQHSRQRKILIAQYQATVPFQKKRNCCLILSHQFLFRRIVGEKL